MMLRFLDQKDILELKQKTVLNNCDVHDVGYFGMIIMMFKMIFLEIIDLKKITLSLSV